MKDVMAKMKKRKGFTLVELIVVIAMIAILAGIAVPSYQGYRERAHISNDGALAAIAQNAILVSMADENIVRRATATTGTNVLPAATNSNSWIAISNDTATGNTVKVTVGPGLAGRDGKDDPSSGEIAALASLINGGKEAQFAYAKNAGAVSGTPNPASDGGVFFFIDASNKVTYEIDGRDYYSTESENRTVPTDTP